MGCETCEEQQRINVILVTLSARRAMRPQLSEKAIARNDCPLI
jgi:hypothetical protein